MKNNENNNSTEKYRMGQSTGNIARADEAISCLPDADLFVLPEMFSTGFCTQPEGIAESADSETLHWMKRKAAERNCAIAGSVAVCENGNYYNRFYFVHPDEPCSIMIRNICSPLGANTSVSLPAQSVWW